jgi:pyrroloquinoline quinone biosynthesis protein D
VSGPRLTQKARLKWDGRDNRYLLLYPERGLALSDTSAEILKLCDGAHPVDVIVDELARSRPNTSRGTILDDVASFLDQMRKLGIVRDT